MDGETKTRLILFTSQAKGMIDLFDHVMPFESRYIFSLENSVIKEARKIVIDTVATVEKRVMDNDLDLADYDSDLYSETMLQLVEEVFKSTNAAKTVLCAIMLSEVYLANEERENK